MIKGLIRVGNYVQDNEVKSLTIEVLTSLLTTSNQEQNKIYGIITTSDEFIKVSRNSWRFIITFIEYYRDID